MKRAILFLLAAIALAGAGAVGWWLRGRDCVDYFSILGDFHATGINYTARAYWETNRDLEIQLIDPQLSSSRSASPRCFIIPRGPDSIEIVYYSGDPKTPEFSAHFQEKLRTFALKRLAEITSEDQTNASKP